MVHTDIIRRGYRVHEIKYETREEQVATEKIRKAG